MRKDDSQNLKINSAMREGFLEICKKTGIKESKAIEKFISYTIEKDGFDIDLSNYKKIISVKTDTRICYRIDSERKEKFKSICEINNIPVSGAVKLFMDDVIKEKSMGKYFN